MPRRREVVFLPEPHHRKGTALPQGTRSCSSRDRKSAECRAGGEWGRGSGTCPVCVGGHLLRFPHTPEDRE